MKHKRVLLFAAFLGIGQPCIYSHSIRHVLRRKLRAPWKQKTQVLNLSGRGITSLDGIEEVASKYPHLKQLYLSNNKLTSVPVAISRLKSLTSLSLENNNIRKLPDSIVDMWRLETLLLAGNQLQRLPREMELLESLKFLDIGGNYFIPSTLTAIKSRLPEVMLRESGQRLLPNLAIGAPEAEGEICPICREGEVNYKTTCGHYFHATDLAEHIEASKTSLCPVCRRDIFTGNK